MCDRYAISFYWCVSAVQVCPEGHRAAEVQFSPVLSPLSLNLKNQFDRFKNRFGPVLKNLSPGRTCT